MVRHTTIAAVAALFCASAQAQSYPTWLGGEEPSPASWESYFGGKLDTKPGAPWGTADWLSAGASFQLPWPVSGAGAAILSHNGQIGLTVASRASDLLTSYGSLQTTIPVANFAFNDDVYASSGRHITVYGGYFEAQALPGSQGITFGPEIDAVNLSTLYPPIPTPGSPLSWGTPGVNVGSTAALWLASGGQHTGVMPASFALGIANNGAQFLTGIVFANNSLAPNVGGYSWAMRMGEKQIIQWHDSADAAGPMITSTVATAANGHTLQFQDGGTVVTSVASGLPIFQVEQVAGAVNGVAVQPSVAGVGASVVTFGNDANVQLNLTPKGSGIVYTPATMTVGGNLGVNGGVSVTGGATVQNLTVNGTGGPTITVGSGAPGTSVQPKGSIYIRTGGAVGSTVYISQGGGTWNAIGGV